MKRITLLICLIWVFIFSSCLVYEQMTVTITLANDFKAGTVEVSYSGISSSDSSEVKQRQDFDDLIAMLNDDDFLLDSVDV